MPGSADPRPPATAPAPPPAASGPSRQYALRHHGDAEVRDDGAELTDLAVNVRTGTPPHWLRERIATSLDGLAAYPDGRAARRAVAARHGLPEERVLLTAGAAEAFVLLARALRTAQPVVVHPQFTEPEAALRDAGHRVRRVLLRPEDGFRLDPAAVPDDADLVVVGNPTNPTSVLHPSGTLAALDRPGRTLVVDEAFIDAVPGERESLAPLLAPSPPGPDAAGAAGTALGPGQPAATRGRLVVLRSLTKTWGLAGLRVGYALSDPGTIAALAHEQPLWPVSSPALAAAEACVTPEALAEAEAAARRFGADRDHLLARLGELPGLSVAGLPEGPFVLVRHPRAAWLRSALRERGFAVRRGDTFPGLGPEWLRLAVRDRETTGRLVAALARLLG
ncbi:threonine-phosphate decarboxylase [Streptomyces sp. AJS327]|uniref:Rv2231c family pyridoxal phosphate-dependent protein CobC n=1 Tax=Streptomyces sp. AJS327 TaxID=2545265 RepID=UPI0015DD9A1F|nr:Rv2231c family pyridoxal phosphate-dependent protein CobC [Streptomyces sp. AJS327]MBA0050477.1 threonine-phosphate decarboxylase [Streptomyces sp. AJS327]